MGLFSSTIFKKTPVIAAPDAADKRFAHPVAAIPESPIAEVVAVIPESPDKRFAHAVEVIPESPLSLPAVREDADTDATAGERALRDEKVSYVRTVFELSRAANIPEPRAAELVAEKDINRFPRLAVAGKNGTSALRYNNYRNWVLGNGAKQGLGRLNDGTPDYRNADALLANYKRGTALAAPHGDPAFWTAITAAFIQT